MIAGSLLAPVRARRTRPAYVMAAGLAIAAAGLCLHTQVGSEGGVPLLVAGLILASGGISLPMPLVTNIVLGAAPPEKAGSAASMMETSGEFGVALGVATMGSLGTLVYRSQLAGARPADVPAAAAHIARESAPAAVAAAQQLPAPLGAALLEAAHAAFTAGLNTVAGAGAIILVTLAILAAAALRRSGEPAAVPAAAAA
jgi:DHA2 family multidrug resistance protein-like MFS transporter